MWMAVNCHYYTEKKQVLEKDGFCPRDNGPTVLHYAYREKLDSGADPEIVKVDEFRAENSVNWNSPMRDILHFT